MKKPPSYTDTPARSLVGQRMLIVETHFDAEGNLRVHARTRLKGKLRQRVCFKAGVVVKQQLEAQRFFPVWARLTLVQGKAHEYYSLYIACTTEFRGEAPGQQWRVNYDPETKTYTNL
jgi:hypothetical protein